MDWLKTPCILHWSFFHFVVLKRVKKDSVIIFYPAAGKLKVDFAQVSACFTGVALEMQPTTDFKKLPAIPKIDIYRDYFKSSGIGRALFQLVTVSILVEILAISSPLYQQWVIDGVMSTGDMSLLLMLAVGFLLIYALSFAMTLLRSWMAIQFSHDVNMQWSSGIFVHALRLPISFYEKRHLGDVISKFSSASAITRTLTASTFMVIVDGVLAILTLGFMGAYSAMLAAISVSFLVLHIAVKFWAQLEMRSLNQSEISAASKQQTYFIETFRGIRTIRLLNMEEKRASRWLEFASTTENIRHFVERNGALQNSARSFLTSVEALLVIYVGAQMIIAKTMTLGMLFAYLMYKNQFSSRALGLVESFQKISLLRVHGHQVADIVLTDAEPGFTSTFSKPDLPATIEVRGLSFRYSKDGPWIFRNVSFAVAAGKTVALTGPSGCGKSTFVRLLLGLEAFEEGEILLGGVSVKKLGVRASRGMFGSVMQEDVLFSGSILENIAVFDDHADEQRVESCGRLANIHAEINLMPLKYRTLIGDMGSSLSGGQKQRILLARALYHKPSMLLLDEATSHLDLSNEEIINSRFRDLGLTQLIVAHRPGTISQADRVLTIDALNIIEVFQKV